VASKQQRRQQDQGWMPSLAPSSQANGPLGTGAQGAGFGNSDRLAQLSKPVLGGLSQLIRPSKRQASGDAATNGGLSSLWQTTLDQTESVQENNAELARLGFSGADALTRFQKLHGLPETGEMDEATTETLARAQVASISLSEFQAMAPGVDEDTLREWLPYLNTSMVQGDISNPKRIAAYMAQLGHESDNFKTFEEYASGAQYEGRRDLGNTRRGDGRRYKGRGAIQITGRYNYGRYGEMIGEDLVNNPEAAALPENAFAVSAAYWSDNDLNRLADQDRFDSISYRINGGWNGKQDRRNKHRRAQRVLSERDS